MTDLQHSAAAAAVDANDSIGITAVTISPRKMAMKRYLHHRGALIATIVLAVIVVFVALAPITARYGVNESIFVAEAGKPNQNLPPSSLAWFGTDANGRDLYSRMIYGARVSLLIGLFTGVISVFIGTIIGAMAGLKGGRFDDLVMRAIDIMLSLPFLVSLIIVRQMLANLSWFTSIVGEASSIRFLIVFLAFLGWMGVARLVRGQVKQLKEREFIEAAKALGASTPRILFRHLLPNAVGQLMVALSFAVVGAITAEATLSFFGYGPDPGSGQTSLGLLIRDSKKAAPAGWWWLVVYPGVLLIIISLCINFIGDGMRDAVDPKMQAGS